MCQSFDDELISFSLRLKEQMSLPASSCSIAKPPLSLSLRCVYLAG